MWSLLSFIFVSALWHGAGNLNIVSRKEWGARPPVETTLLTVPVPKVFIHHTVMDPCDSKSSCIKSMQAIQNFHMDDRGWWDIGYNFLVGGDGRVYVGRGWDAVGAQTKGYNTISVGISFIGDFTNILPTEEAMEAAHQLIQVGLDQGKIAENYKLHGHRDANNLTACPGNTLYPKIQTWPHYDPNVN